MSRLLILTASVSAILLIGAAPPVKPKPPVFGYMMSYNPNRAIKDETIPLRIEHSLTETIDGRFRILEETLLIQYGALGKDRRAQGVSVMMTPTGLKNANKHWVDGRIDPPGWKDDSGMTRLMLLPYNLGGNGEFARNLVAVNRAEVVPKYAAVMDRIRRAVVKQQKTVNFSITPVYGERGMPTSLFITADIPLDGENKWVAITNEPPVKKVIQESDLTRLKRLMPPPRRPIATGSAKQWQEVEKRQGLTFPDDYKQFVSTYGAGEINEFVRIKNPFRAGKYDDFEAALKWHKEHWPKSKAQFPDHYPYDAWPAEGGLVPLGSTVNGDGIYWRAKGKPNDWTIIVHDRGGKGYREIPCGWVAFLRRGFEDDIQLNAWSPGNFQPKFAAVEAK